MDTPNAPNPTNPNAQDQFMDAVQGPAAQAQGPAAQNQAQGPAAQVQGLAAQGPTKTMSQLVRMYPFSLHTTWPQQTSPCWSGGACPSSSLSKLGRKET